MAYTKQQIADYARQLGAKGASAAEIEAFVANASRDVVDAPASREVVDEYPVRKNPRTGLPERTAFDNPKTWARDQANFTRMAAPAVGALAGPIGAIAGGVGGEALAQEIEGGDKRTGAMVGAGIANAFLPTRLASPILNALRSGGINLAAKATETGIDEGRAPSIREALMSAGLGAAGDRIGARVGGVSREAPVLPPSWTPTQRDTIVAGMEKGLKIAPVEVRDTFLNRRMMGAAGPTDVTSEIRRQNQIRGNELVKEDINIPKSQDITDANIAGEIKRASGPMAEIEAISPEFQQALDRVRRAREEASLVWQARKEDYRKVTPEQAQAAQQAVKDAETELGLMVNQVDPTLGRRYGIARQEVARANVAKEAVNPADANVDFRDLGARVADRLPLDRNMEVLGNFAASGVGSRYLGPRTANVPGSTALRTGMAVVGAAEAGPDNLAPAVGSGGYWLVNDIARKRLVSDALQKEILGDLVGREVMSKQGDAIRRVLMTAGRQGETDEERRLREAIEKFRKGN